MERERDFPLFSHTRPLPWREEPRRLLALAAVTAAIAWLPVALLAARAGQLGAFLHDPGPHGRLLISLPLLILAPTLVNPRMAEVARHFLRADLIAPDERNRYSQQLDRLLRLRDSRLVQVLCLAAALTAAVLAAVSFERELAGSEHLAWRLAPDGGPSAAAVWHAVVALPLYYYVVLGFTWRVLLWWSYLWRTSRLNLKLAPGHPDQAAGLGFLAVGLRGFQPAVFALAVAPAGALASVVLERRPPFQDPTFSVATAGVVALAMVIMAVFPLTFFSWRLLEARRDGQLAYSALSERQLRRFEAKWLDTPPGEMPDPLETPDFSAVIDLSSTVATAGRLRVTPFSRTDLLRLAFAAIVPFAPVALIEVPATEILREAVKLLL
ncbi:hypothetical protein [Caulobacter sp. 17J65-9]|uniref:hypothetical protein n=1 Tax=Caulobacter sp. 17J65-9 TaxID=2709382 RepID=UPI0013C63C29|nr:hypothetical protein [Caulobacter sp. 17J65-9]NEX93803.1 hypothetical protein [Caulobacter sp. 17J65-9]